MPPRHRETFEPAMLAHIRAHGCRDLLVYCASGRCKPQRNHNADWNAGAALCPRMVCTRYGLIGAEVRPDWSPHTNKRRVWLTTPSGRRARWKWADAQAESCRRALQACSPVTARERTHHRSARTGTASRSKAFEVREARRTLRFARRDEHETSDPF